jgi:hypothetical protein
MRFALAMPGAPFVPPGIAASPTVSRLADNILLNSDGRALAAARLRAYLVAADVDAVVVTRGTDKPWLRAVRAATSQRPLDLNGSMLFRVSDDLTRMHVTGELSVAHRPAPLRILETWLRFDGTRAHVRALLGGRIATLSSPNGDAESPSGAINAVGDAAVAFTEWRAHAVALRIATNDGTGWHTTTLETSPFPIWEPRVAVAADGAVVATWVVANEPGRTLRAAVRHRHGYWLRAQTLEAGLNIDSVSVCSGQGDVAVAAWRDSLARENRVRADVYEHGRWLPPQTISTTFAVLGAVRVIGRRAGAVDWEQLDGFARPLLRAWRTTHGWTRPAPVLRTVANPLFDARA